MVQGQVQDKLLLATVQPQAILLGREAGGEGSVGLPACRVAEAPVPPSPIWFRLSSALR